VASDSSMCPEADSASKNEYQDISGGKDGQQFWSLDLPETPKATRPVVGLLYLTLL